MDNELDLLLGAAIDSLLKLDALLHLLDRPGAVQSAEEIAGRLRRPTYQVSAALDQLAQAGLVDRFALGTGRHVVYGSAEDEHVRQLIGLLQSRYRDPETRGGIARAVIQRGAGD